MGAKHRLRKFQTADPSDVLVLEAGGIGDAVMATPALAAIRRRFPRARVAVVVAPRAAEIVESLHLNFELKKLRLGDALAQLADAARIILRARLARPDVLIDLSSIESTRAAGRRRRLVKLIGAQLSLGRDTDGRGNFFDAAAEESLLDQQHEVERKLKVLAPLNVGAEGGRPSLRAPRQAQESARLLLQEAGISEGSEMVGINPGALRPSRRWPLENFVRLASSLTAGRRRALLVTGGPEERKLAEEVARAAGGQVVTATGRPLMELAALIGSCRVFITNDTGAMHIAAAQDVPVVALFGQTNVHRYRPRMDPRRCVVLKQPAEVCTEATFVAETQECRRHSCPSGECMRSISFESVSDAAERLLASAQAGAPR